MFLQRWDPFISRYVKYLEMQSWITAKIHGAAGQQEERLCWWRGVSVDQSLTWTSELQMNNSTITNKQCSSTQPVDTKEIASPLMSAKITEINKSTHADKQQAPGLICMDLEEESICCSFEEEGPRNLKLWSDPANWRLNTICKSHASITTQTPEPGGNVSNIILKRYVSCEYITQVIYERQE